MDAFIRSERPPDVLFHDVAMLIDLRATNGDGEVTLAMWCRIAALPICGIRAASALGVTTRGAESPSAIFDSVGSGEELFPALFAGSGDDTLLRHRR
jgi:hypothetical protein